MAPPPPPEGAVVEGMTRPPLEADGMGGGAIEAVPLSPSLRSDALTATIDGAEFIFALLLAALDIIVLESSSSEEEPTREASTSAEDKGGTF
jgi:hypothetical protein